MAKKCGQTYAFTLEVRLMLRTVFIGDGSVYVPNLNFKRSRSVYMY